MNTVDYVVERQGARVGGFGSVVVVHGDDLVGRDTAAGARIAAEANDLPLGDVVSRPDGRTVIGDEVAAGRPLLALVATRPDRAAGVVTDLRDRDGDAVVVVTNRAWDPLALDDPAEAPSSPDLLVARPVREFTMASVGHGEMRAALAGETPDEAAATGWALNHPLYDSLAAAAAAGVLTRAGVLDALTTLDEVDYRGMLPQLSGAVGKDTPAGQAALRAHGVPGLFLALDPEAPTGIRIVDEYYNSITAATYPFHWPCAGPTPTAPN